MDAAARAGASPRSPTSLRVVVHPLAAHFGSAADVYERGRPGYPPEVVGALVGALGLQPQEHVLDLAAGTGKLTRGLVAAGLSVSAVEPSPEMRARLETTAPGTRILDGLAERIPLDSGSLAAVTVADAFHWFDAPSALAEIRRVLIAGGGLASINALPDWSSLEVGPRIGELIDEVRPEHPFFDGPPWAELVAAEEGWGDLREVSVVAPQPASAAQLVAYVGSISFIAGLPDAKRVAWLDRVAVLLDGAEIPPELPVNYRIGLAARD